MINTTIVDCSGVGAGGITRVLSELVRYWPARQRLAIVAAPAGWQPPAERSADVDLISHQSGGRAGSIAAATTALRQATGRTEPARVLSLSPSVAAAASRLPVTTVVHDLAFKLWPRELSASVRQYRRLSYASAIKRSARLICVSARTQHDLYGLYGVPAERTRVWHPGSDLSVVPGALPPSLAEVRGRGGRYLVIAGHAAHKGVELAIEAVTARPEYTLAVLTGGERVEQFEAAAVRSGIADRVLFVERLSDAAYAATIAGAAAFLMPSHFEGYGLPAAEALRLGTPTIISPDPALLEATNGAAIRMTSWTGAALLEALADIGHPPDPHRTGGRSWHEATEDLFALLAEQPLTVPAAATSLNAD
jgi:glycosyltransferase involved in cell wall biosynthesis